MGIWRFFTKKSGIFPDFPGFFPDFPDFTLLCKIFSNENAIKPENLTSLAIQWILPKLFVTGTKQRFIRRFFTKKSGFFPDFPGFFPDFPDFTLLCKIFSNENAIKPKNLTFMAIIMDFAQTFCHGHQTTLHLAVFYKKIRNFPGFFPDFPGFPGFWTKQ